MDQIKNNELLSVSKEDAEKFSTLEAEVEFFQQCVEFLKLIDCSIDKMVELLETTSTTDMHEAIEFFTAAYRFNIDRASIGILGKLIFNGFSFSVGNVFFFFCLTVCFLAMLKLMQRNEQERKDVVVKAFKIIYLQTEAESMK